MHSDLVLVSGCKLCNVMGVLLVTFTALDAQATFDLQRTFQPDAVIVLGKKVADKFAVHAGVFATEENLVFVLRGKGAHPAKKAFVARLAVFKRAVVALFIEIVSLQYYCVKLCFGKINTVLCEMNVSNLKVL